MYPLGQYIGMGMSYVRLKVAEGDAAELDCVFEVPGMEIYCVGVVQLDFYLSTGDGIHQCFS